MNSSLKTGLIILSIVVWSAVCYRIYKQVSGNTKTYMSVNMENNSVTNPLDSTFIYIPDFKYRDPFSKGIYTAANTIKRGIRKQSIKISLKWPQITYQGLISDQNKKTLLAIVSINGKENIMSPQVMIDSVKISHLYIDSALFVFKKERKMIKRS
jgi:hypothetical protein